MNASMSGAAAACANIIQHIAFVSDQGHLVSIDPCNLMNCILGGIISASACTNNTMPAAIFLGVVSGLIFEGC